MKTSTWIARLIVGSCLIGAGCKSTTTVVQPQPVVSNSQMSLGEIIDLTRNGSSAAIIINQINATNSTFRLSTEDIGMLKQQGVNDAVIEYMQRRVPAGPVAAGPPPAYVAPGTVVYPAAYPVYGPAYVYPYGWRRGY